MSQIPSLHSSPRANLRIAYVQASWHADIVGQAHTGFVAELTRLGVPDTAVQCYSVPGAFEIPLHAQRLAASGAFDAVVACAFVVDGGIYRHDFVASTVVDALMRVQLDSGVPVFSVVLTPHHFHEHALHQQVFHDHFVQKGAEAAQACVRTVESLRALDADLAPPIAAAA